MIGTTVSHYRILEKLGEGGMGVVYKAQDTKLNRSVALKFLPSHLTTDTEAKERFVHEAQAASALQHNNICGIHEIGESPDGQLFIVMDLYEGETLKSRIAKGELRIEEAVQLTIQISQGLQNAHEKGIVHRDIKPANILVTTDGVAKIVDFGLAKLTGRMQITKTGGTVGTVAYMSPEQARGEKADHRTDMWSLGVTIYEMITGQLPFKSDYHDAVVYSILNASPQPITGVRTGVPVELERIVNKCLEKNASDRYQHIVELIVDLHHLKGTTPDIAVSWMLGKKKIRPFILPVVAVLGLILVLVGYFFNPFLLSHAPQLNPDMKISQLQIPFRDVWYPNVSKDGRWLVFPASDVNGKYDVYMMNLSQGQPKKVTNDSSDGIFGVAISPDASTILYSRRRLAEQTDQLANELVSVPWLGGKSRVIIDTVTNGNWRPDGERIGYHVIRPAGSGRQINELWTAKPDGSDRHCEIADTLEVSPLLWTWDWSPDMKSVVWLRWYAGGYNELIIRNLETGKERQLTFDKKFADDGRWTQNGSIIFSSNRAGNRNLWMVPSSGGEPVQLTRGSGPDTPIWISADCRRMIYSEDQRIGQIKLGNLADGSVRQLTVDERFRLQPSISPTGALIAFVVANESGAGTDIYVMDRQGAEIRALTGGPEVKLHPSWSPDERWITYSAFRFTEPADSSRVYLIKADNSSQPRLIGNGTAAYCFSEKEFIVWGSTKSYRGSVDRPGLVEFAEDSVWICPILDGKYMVVRDNRVGREGAWITTARSYESSGLKEARQLVKGAALWPVFARDGRELFYTEPGGAHDLHRISLPDGKDEKVGRVFPGLRDFSVRRDGKEIVYSEFHQKTRFQIIDNLFK